MFYLKECIFWTKLAHRISTLWTFQCFSEVAQIPYVNFEAKNQGLYKSFTNVIS